MSEANATEIDGIPIERAPEDTPPPAEPTNQIDTPPAEEPPPAAEAPPAAPEGEPPPATPPPPPGPELPEWIASIDEDKREAALNVWIGSLTKAQRAKLPAVQELVSEVATQAEFRAREQATRETEQASLQGELADRATSLADRLRPIVGDQLDVNAEINAVANYAEEQAIQGLAADVNQGMSAAFQRVGVKQLPPDAHKAIVEGENATNQIYAYGLFMFNAGHATGGTRKEAEVTEASKANEAANRARMKAEALGQLAEDKRIRIGKDEEGYFVELVVDKVPPVISGQSLPGGGGLTPEAYRQRLESGDLPSEEDIDAATRRLLQPA